MKPDDFDFVSQFFKDRSGLVLTREKAYLLESRLMPVARKKGLKSLEELVAAMRAGRDSVLLRDVTEAMTINESFFFRDIKPFDLFRATVLPRLLQSRAAKKTLRIWCAACSSGQEPYSLAMIMREEAARLAGWRNEILGTDISSEMVAKAKAGLYSQFEVQRGLPIQLLVKYFRRRATCGRSTPPCGPWCATASTKLCTTSRAGRVRRGVLPPTSSSISTTRPRPGCWPKIRAIMPDDGILFLGGAETVLAFPTSSSRFPTCAALYAGGEECRGGAGHALPGRHSRHLIPPSRRRARSALPLSRK
jgi:chemotaxis protein methyltransferase CheR